MLLFQIHLPFSNVKFRIEPHFSEDKFFIVLTGEAGAEDLNFVIVIDGGSIQQRSTGLEGSHSGIFMDIVSSDFSAEEHLK